MIAAAEKPDTAIVTGFVLPDDGWFHIATPGEWPHKPTGLTQILDDDAMQSIVDAFTEAGKQPNWPGVLIDFDHQSLDEDKPTTAAGWISELERRPTGIWAKIRWSDLGRKSIEGGRYRFISPVWRSSDCDMLEGDRIRPLKLMNCAVTNDPNIKGLFPLSNAAHHKSLRFSPPAVPLANSRIMNLDEDKQRRAMFAAMARGGGGGGRSRPSGGGGGGGPSGSSQSQASGPASPPTPQPGQTTPSTPSPLAEQHFRAAQQAREQRDALLLRRPPRPEPPQSLERVNVLEAVREAHRTGLVDTLNLRQYERQLRDHNRAVSSKINQIRRGHRTIADQDRAVQRYLDREQRNYEQAMRSWTSHDRMFQRQIQNLEKEIRDREIAGERENERAANREFRESLQLLDRAFREHQADRRAEERDRTLTRQESAEQRLRERHEAQMNPPPMTPWEQQQHEASVTTRQREETHNAVLRGDYDFAKRVSGHSDAEVQAYAALVEQIRTPQIRADERVAQGQPASVSRSDIQLMNDLLSRMSQRTIRQNLEEFGIEVPATAQSDTWEPPDPSQPSPAPHHT